MSHKSWCLVLHSHIPYVINHGRWPHGADWLFEVCAESYLPLLTVLYRLRDEGITPNVNLSFTPVLMEQLKNHDFAPGFKRYLQMKIDLARDNRAYFAKTGQNRLVRLAQYWESWYQRAYEDFVFRWKEDILNGFKKLQDEKQVEILTSAATHAYLPLLSDDRSVRFQLQQGQFVYEQCFGQPPAGFWLPECAYRPRYGWKRPLKAGPTVLRPGLDELLRELGLKYFFVDTHLLRGGEVKGVYLERFPVLKKLWQKAQEEQKASEEQGLSPYFPYLAEPSGLPFFVRDDKSGSLVWSGQAGYPGDGWYLEFHKKHFPGGLRYWRVTSAELGLGEKQIYQPEKAGERLEEQSTHFVSLLGAALKNQEAGVIASLYDTELFGHWWFEGPEWLYLVVKKLSKTKIKPERARVCLERLNPQIPVSLPEGSWGTGGFHWVWLNQDTTWVWEKIYWLEDEWGKIYPDLAKSQPRLYRQWLREKLLLESSDWPFLISTWTARDYAENRAAEHYERAKIILKWIKRDAPLKSEEQEQLLNWEKEDSLFPQFFPGGAE